MEAGSQRNPLVEAGESEGEGEIVVDGLRAWASWRRLGVTRGMLEIYEECCTGEWKRESRAKWEKQGMKERTGSGEEGLD